MLMINNEIQYTGDKDMNGYKYPTNYTVVLSTRSHVHLGQIAGIDYTTFAYTRNLSEPNEVSFTVYKYDFVNELPKDQYNQEILDTIKKTKEKIWENIIDLKFIYIKEFNEYFEISISSTDSTESYKTITGRSACEAELSQYNIKNLEVNSEEDINNDLYDENFPTIFYRDPSNISAYQDIWNTSNEKYTVYNKGTTTINTTETNNKRSKILRNSSLLHRILDSNAPHYSIGHIDDSLKNMQRTFSVSGSDVYDFLSGDVSEQFNCLFMYDSVTRTISAYDMSTICLKDGCGYKGDFYEECPKCHNRDPKLIKYFGKNTKIYVDKTNLTNEIQLEMNVDNIKNCLQLVAGDELMTSTIKLLNPNGSDYIYYLSDLQKNDMPQELIDRINNYNVLYNSRINGYQEKIVNYYNVIDEILYLESGMMKADIIGDVTSSTEASKITNSSMKNIAVSKLTKTTSASTASIAVKNYAKYLVYSGYVKVEIDEDTPVQWNLNKLSNGELSSNNGVHSGTWKGKLIITNYSDKEDTTTTALLTITITDNMKDFTSQKILKTIDEDDEDGVVGNVLKDTNLTSFRNNIKQYSYNRLVSFHDAIDSVLNVLQSMGISKPTPDPSDPEYDITTANLYEEMYLPYWNKLQICTDAMEDIKTNPNFVYYKNNERKQGCIDSYKKEKEQYETEIDSIHEELDFEKYLGDYYNIFCAYKREDTYENSNYISDGLSNAELISRAKEFREVAEKELVKAAEPQYTISAELYNLLKIDEFKEFAKYFELGNWIKVKIDNKLYKRLRLISYTINGDNEQNLQVEFSTLKKNEDYIHDIKQIIQSASSISTNFDYIEKQANKGNDASAKIREWLESGLDSSMIRLKNNSNEEVVQDKHGLLFRSYDDIENSYSNEQARLTHNMLIFTDDNWQTAKSALGKHKYTYYDAAENKMIPVEKYGLSTEFITSGNITGSTIMGGNIYSDNYSNGQNSTAAEGTHIDLRNGEFSFAGGSLTYNKEDGLVINDKVITNSLQSLGVVNDQVYIKADKITGKISSDNISSVKPSQVVASGQDNQLNANLIPSLPASKITSGTFDTSRIPSLPPSHISTSNGTFNANLIPNLSASKITTDTLSDERIPTTMSNKTLTNTTLNGTTTMSNVQVNGTLTVNNNGNNYTGLTGTYTIGDTTIRLVKGLIVEITNG